MIVFQSDRKLWKLIHFTSSKYEVVPDQEIEEIIEEKVEIPDEFKDLGRGKRERKQVSVLDIAIRWKIVIGCNCLISMSLRLFHLTDFHSVYRDGPIQ